MRRRLLVTETLAGARLWNAAPVHLCPMAHRLLHLYTIIRSFQSVHIHYANFQKEVNGYKMPFIDLIHTIRENATQSPLLAAVIGIVVLLLVVSLARRDQSNHQILSNNKANTPRQPLSWFPIVGHLPEIVIGGDGYLNKLSARFPEGIWTLQLYGKKRYFVTDPELQASLYNKSKSVVNGDSFNNSLLKSNFAFSEKDIKQQDSFADDARKQFQHLNEEPGLGKATTQMVDDIKSCIGDFVTFNSYPADQAEWENVTGVRVVSSSTGQEFVEADLLELVRNFMGPTAMGAIFGPDFVVNFPDVYQLLWQFDKGFAALKQSSPWLPSGAAQRARAAQVKMLSYFCEFETAMGKNMDGQDAGARWQDLDCVGEIVKGRVEVWRRNGFSIEGRAASDLALLWTATSTINPATAWMIFEICRDPIILEEVQREVSRYLKIRQPENDFGPAVWIAPEIESVDVHELLSDCHTLKAAYMETLRLYMAPRSVLHTKTDVEVQAGSTPFVIKTGHEINILHEAYQMNSERFPDPLEFQPARHIKNAALHKPCELGLRNTQPYGMSITSTHYCLEALLITLLTC